MSVTYLCCCMTTKLHVGLVCSLYKCLLCIFVAVWRSSFVWVLSTACINIYYVSLLLYDDQASCGSCLQLVLMSAMYLCCCMTIKLRAGLVYSLYYCLLCIFVAVWQSIFVRVLSTACINVCYVSLLLYDDQASSGSCLQLVLMSAMYLCCCMTIKLCAGLVYSLYKGLYVFLLLSYSSLYMWPGLRK